MTTTTTLKDRECGCGLESVEQRKVVAEEQDRQQCSRKTRDMFVHTARQPDGEGECFPWQTYATASLIGATCILHVKPESIPIDCLRLPRGNFHQYSEKLRSIPLHDPTIIEGEIDNACTVPHLLWLIGCRQAHHVKYDSACSLPD